MERKNINRCLGGLRMEDQREQSPQTLLVNTFSFKMRQKNLSKSTKNVRNFTDVIRCMNACSNEQLVTQKRMREFLISVPLRPNEI